MDLWPDAVVRYAATTEGVIDLHLPTRPNGTVVFLVHGGFWQEQYDRTHTRYQARALAALGYLVATPEYRRVGGSGGWPETGEDVRDAYVALPQALAGLDLTYERVVTMGHSAGGQLVLWLAAQELRRPPDRTVALAAVCDLELARELDLDGGAVNSLLNGADISTADPQSLFAGPPPGPVVLLHGDRDDLVPVELSRRFVARHPWSHLIELPDVDHFAFLDPREPAWQTLTSALDPQAATAPGAERSGEPSLGATDE